MSKEIKSELVEGESNQVATIATVPDMSVQLTEIAKTYGDSLPYHRGQLITETKFYMSQSAEAMLEAGRRLILLKENEAHGDFTKIIEHELNLSPRTARLMMQASFKFLNIDPTKRQALADLGKTKLFELLIEDDSDLEALAEGGTVAGLTLDDMDKMTTRELKAALKDAKENDAAVREVVSKKEKRIEELNNQLTDLDIKLEKAKQKQIQLKLKGDDTAAIVAEHKAVLMETIAQISASNYRLVQLIEESEKAILPESFFKLITVEVAAERDKLNVLLERLPSDVAPIDTSWLDGINPETGEVMDADISMSVKEGTPL